MATRGFPNLLRVVKVTVSDSETLFVFPISIGIILSGNLVSQVLLALILSYAGGQRNRPKWIAGSVLLGSVSSFLLASGDVIPLLDWSLNELTVLSKW